MHKFNMLKSRILKVSALAMTTALLFSSNALAEDNNSEDRIDESKRVYVYWVNPKDFTDIKPSNGIRSKFRNRTMEELHEFVDKLAKKLPEGHKLKLNVTDLDLAGRVWPGHFAGLNSASDVRVVRKLDIPRLDFSFELMNGSGEVLKSGVKELKDLSFMTRIGGIQKHDSLRYEKNMLKAWFKREFKDELAVNQS